MAIQELEKSYITTSKWTGREVASKSLAATA